MINKLRATSYKLQATSYKWLRCVVRKALVACSLSLAQRQLHRLHSLAVSTDHDIKVTRLGYVVQVVIIEAKQITRDSE